ncbi:MAG: hypothetical protein JWN67_3702 [Actinomycetia bacterium]|nr:hypothetical protein [Actinomycetes bacterium]
MPTLPDLLDQAVGPIAPAHDTPDVHRRIARRRRRRQVVVGAAVVVALVAGIVAWPRPDDRRHVRTTEPGLFPGATGTVLLLDDGYDGILLVDLDHRVAVRRVVEGQRAGDQDVRLSRTGDDLVVGWGAVHAAPLNGGPSRLLGSGVVSVPAAEPGTVWLFDYEKLEPPARARRIDVTGKVLDDLQVFGRPIVGVRGGLLVRRPDTQIELVPEPSSPGLVPRIIGHGLAQVVTASETLVAYCDDDAFCTTVNVLDVATGRTIATTLARAGEAVDVATAAFSPSSLELAIRVGDRIVAYRPAEPTGRRVELDLPAGSPHVSLAWGSEHDLYVLEDTDPAHVTHLDVSTGQRESATLPFALAVGGTLAVPRSDVAAMLDVSTGPADRCGTPVVQPSGRKDACSFRF